MTREEFMILVEPEIDSAFQKLRNRMMNLVQQAWAEGKRSAETEQVAEIVKGAVAEIQKQLQPVQPVVVPPPFGEPITTPTWPYNPIPPFTCDASKGNVPEAHFEEGDTDGDNDN